MNNTKNLDGSSFTYTYPELGTVEIDFYDGLLKYEWKTGHYKGTKKEGSTYKAKKIYKNTFFINWLEKSNSTFVSLIIDVGQGIIHSSAQLNPRTDEEIVLFHDASIESYKLAEN